MKLFRKLNSPITTSIGMFDLLKGIILLLVVYHHNRNLFPTEMFDIATGYSDKNILHTISLIYEKTKFLGDIGNKVIGQALMPTLFIVSGFSIRKRTISKSVSLGMEELMKPYFCTAIVTVLLNIIIHFCTFRYIPGAIKESLKLFGGMLLGFDQTVQFWGVTFFANGPIWFLLGLFWLTVLFNILLNKVDEKKLIFYVLGVDIIGCLMYDKGFTFFGLARGLIYIIFIYMGYYARKHKVLMSRHSWKVIIIYALLVTIPFIVQSFIGFSLFYLGIIYGFVGIGLIYVSLRINKAINGKISNALRYLGRYSLYFLCIHTVEMIAIPWYAVIEKFTNQLFVGFILTFIFRVTIIVLALMILNKFIENYKKQKCRKAV